MPMLKHFRVNNFKNFKDDLDIDFSDVNGYKFSQDCITNDLIGKMIIYGKNGSGKTNLSKALCDLKETLTMSNQIILLFQMRTLITRLRLSLIPSYSTIRKTKWYMNIRKQIYSI